MLSTPPAFILSQDQTLMLKLRQMCLRLTSSIRSIHRLILVQDYLAWLIYPKPSLLGFCSEFSQIQRSKPDLLFSEFSGFYILFNLQLSRFVVAVHLSGNSFIIPQSQLFVNNFFNFIFCYFHSRLHLEKRAEKEGFEPSRRFPDLHP